MVAEALGKAVFGEGVGRAVNGGPELVEGGVEGDDVLGRVEGFGLGVGAGDGEGEHGVVDGGGGGFRRKDSWGGGGGGGLWG